MLEFRGSLSFLGRSPNLYANDKRSWCRERFVFRDPFLWRSFANDSTPGRAVLFTNF